MKPTSKPRFGPCLRALSLVIVASPARADGLEGENTYCVLLGLTLVGVLAGWAILFGSAKQGWIPADSGLAVLAVPTLYVSVVAFFPPPERLMLVAPAVPLVVAVALRTYFHSRSGA